MTRDEHRDAIRERFAADPLPLLTALGVEIDDRKSKPPQLIWAFNGPEAEASLIIGGKIPGLCKAFNEPGESGFDCFALVERVRGLKTFPEQAEFAGRAYGIEPPEATARRVSPRKEQAPEVSHARYEVQANGQVVAVHHRSDRADGTKRIWWAAPDGTAGLPAGVQIEQLPLWASWHVHLRDGAVVVCEGEKDTDAANAHLGAAHAIGTYGADVIPTPEALDCLTGRRVYLWPDNDDAGRKHMASVAANLQGIADQVFTLDWSDLPDLPPKIGAWDWFNALGKTVDDLRAWMRQAREHVPAIADAVDAIPFEPPAQVFRGAVPVESLAMGMIDWAEERRTMPAGIYGMRSGWPTLDGHFGGFWAQGLISLAADSGAGKTTVARHFLFASAKWIIATHGPERLLFYALEGGSEQILPYWAGYEYGVPYWAFEPGGDERMKSYPDVERGLANAYCSLPLLPIDVCTATREADAILCDIERRATDGPIMGVVLDNVQLLEYPRGGNEWANSKLTAMRALDLCDRLKFPLIALTQINRDGKSWKERGGPEWKNNATCQFFADRGDKGAGQEDKVQSNTTTIHNLKRRYGRPSQPLTLIGDWETGRLREQAEHYEQQAPAPTTRREETDEDPWHSN